MNKILSFKKILCSSATLLFTLSMGEWNNAHAMDYQEEYDLTPTQVVINLLLQAEHVEESIANTPDKKSEKNDDLEILRQWRLKHNGEILADNPNASFDSFMANAAKVLPEAQHAIGAFYCEGQQDYYKALKWFEKANTNGWPEAEGSILLAQFRIAKKFYEQKNFSESLVWFKKAAQKEANAQFNIGMLYVDEKIAYKDGKNAIKWFQRVLTNTECLNPLLGAGEKAVLPIRAKEELGRIYSCGLGVPQDLPKAVKYFSEIIDEDLYESCPSAFYQLGHAHYQMGNFLEALKNFKIADEKGEPKATYNIGAMYNQGQGVTEDLKEALTWFEKSKANGFPQAIQTVVDIKFIIAQEAYSKGNYQEVIKYHTLAAEEGHMVSPYNMALMYYFGYGVPVNYNNAIKWFRLAQENGHPDARKNRIILLDKMAEAFAKEKNFSEALKLSIESALEGSPTAAFNVANQHFWGKGTPINFHESLMWFIKAKENGHPRTQQSITQLLGILYMSGLDYAEREEHLEALSKFTTAASYGHADAAYRIGLMHILGKGITKDEDEALKWFILAHKNGHPKAQEAIARIQILKVL